MKNELSPGSPARGLWMVVDDDEGVREFMTALLEMTGRIHVESFSAAAEALRAFTAAPEAYQFILTDLEMPGMNGIEFCRRVRAMRPTVKVLLVSGDVTTSEADAKGWGFCGLVKKPFEAATLREAVEEAC